MHTGCLTCKILHIVSKGKKKATGFPGGTVVKNLPTMQEAQVQSLYQEDGVGNGNPL